MILLLLCLLFFTIILLLFYNYFIIILLLLLSLSLLLSSLSLYSKNNLNYGCARVYHHDPKQSFITIYIIIDLINKINKLKIEQFQQ